MSAASIKSRVGHSTGYREYADPFSLVPVSAGTPGLMVLPAVPKDVVPSQESLVMHAFLSGSGTLVI